MCIVLGVKGQVCSCGQGRRTGCEATGLELLGGLKGMRSDPVVHRSESVLHTDNCSKTK